jgi:predicted nucleotidyltransferase
MKTKFTVEDVKRLASPVFKGNKNVLAASVFGSVVAGQTTDCSDIDFLVKFSDKTSLFDEAELFTRLGKIFHRKIDIADEKNLYPEYRDRIVREKVLIYEKK